MHSHDRPPGVDGAPSHDFRQMLGRADLLLGNAADELAAAGRAQLGEHVRVELVGRNVLEGRWTFQIVEEFDDTY